MFVYMCCLMVMWIDMIMDHQQYQCQSVCYVFKFMHEYSWDEHEYGKTYIDKVYSYISESWQTCL